MKIIPDQRIDVRDCSSFITSRSQAWDALAGVTYTSCSHEMVEGVTSVWRESIYPGK